MDAIIEDKPEIQKISQNKFSFQETHPWILLENFSTETSEKDSIWFLYSRVFILYFDEMKREEIVKR